MKPRTAVRATRGDYPGFRYGMASMTPKTGTANWRARPDVRYALLYGSFQIAQHAMSTIPWCVMASVRSGRLHVARWTTHIGRISAYAFLLPFPFSHQNPSTSSSVRACDETYESSWSPFVFPIFPIVLLESGVRSRSPSASFALLEYCLIASPLPQHIQDCPAPVARRDTHTLWLTNSSHHRLC